MENPNDPYDQPPSNFLDDQVRENPIGVLLAAIGIGMLVALVVRALRPPPPRSHVRHMLEDIRERLEDLADPALHRLGELAEQGSAALKKRAHQADGVAHRLRSIGCKVGSLFH